MKYTIICAVLVQLVISESCKGKIASKDTDNPVVQVSSKTPPVLTKNDTICLESYKEYDLGRLKLVKMCQLNFNEAATDSLDFLQGQGKYPANFNYVRMNKDLLFTIRYDTIEVFKSFLVNNHNYFNIPDKLYFKGDTLFLPDIAKKIRSESSVAKSMYQLLWYQFVITKGSKPTAIRWVEQQKTME